MVSCDLKDSSLSIPNILAICQERTHYVAIDHDTSWLITVPVWYWWYLQLSLVQSSTKLDVTQELFLCGTPIHMHMLIGQGQKLSCPHEYSYTGIDIILTSISLNVMKKVLPQSWNPWDQCLLPHLKWERNKSYKPFPPQSFVLSMWQNDGKFFLIFAVLILTS